MPSDIVERLRGRYPVGEGSPPEFGYRQFPVEPIKVEAADEIESLRSRLAEAERDAARYRFIKQWARRLDITGYSLTNNEHFEPRIDEAMAIASQPSSADVERRPCTCHPDDNPPVPCPRMYALQDCRRAAALAAEIESLRARLAEAETLLREIREDARHFGMPTARIDAHLSRKEGQT